MIGILVAAHGNFAEGILKSVELIMGKQEQIKTLGLYHGDSIEEFYENVCKSIIELDNNAGVLVFVDLFGASPYNAAALSVKQVGEVKFRCITGLNLPMLLEALALRESCSLEELTNKALEAGEYGIKELFNELLKYNIN